MLLRQYSKLSAVLSSIVVCYAAAMAQVVQEPVSTQAPSPVNPISPPPDSGAAPPPSRWPMVIDASGQQIMIYQPQLETFEGDHITARAAVSVDQQDKPQPTFGVIWLDSRVSVDRSARTVQILDTNITRSRFPDANPPDQKAMEDAIRKSLAEKPKILSLDQLLSMLQAIENEKNAGEALQTTPPNIIFRDHPSVKVQYDGAPRLGQIQASPLMRVVNTPFFVVLDPASKAYFLKGGGQWFSAPDPAGPFQSVAQAPPAVAQLADQSGYKDPQEALTPAQASAVEIVTATEPTELIWTDGPEEMATIAGTSLLYVSNTDSDVFLNISDQRIYLLLSGRWYSAASRSGPWVYVPSNKLPPDFPRIPPGSAKGSVLAQVSGTQAAEDAVADTYVPQTAAIDRTKVEAPQINYDGAPQFQPVEGVTASYAVNTPQSVLLVDNRYYCCYQACWYMSNAAVGPWDLCISVPRVIYALPPSCPIYAVKYCHVYGYTPQFVYVGYTPGYVGCYAYDGCVVYGTGYYYRPWIAQGVYYPRPWTFGYAARYEPYTSHWGFAFAFGEGDAWISFGFGGGARQWGGGGFGPGGYRPAYVRNNITINHLTVNRNVYRTNNFYGRADENRFAGSRNLYDRRTDIRSDLYARPQRTPTDRLAPRPDAGRNRDMRDNVYADPQGNVHRKTIDGWESRQNGKWVGGQEVRTPETPRQPKPSEPVREAPADRRGENQSLDRDMRARTAGRDRYENSPHPSESPDRYRSDAPANDRPRNDRASGAGRNDNGRK